MPTSTGSETVGEKLDRLQTELARVRSSIARSENAGASFGGMGASVTQVSYERLMKRESRLVGEITALESRLAGYTPALPGFAVIRTRMPDGRTAGQVSY